MAVSGDIKLLLVEDEMRALERYKNYIKRYGGNFHVVSAASTYKDAQEAFDKNKVDCIFTDVVIPGGTGLELLEYVKASGWHGLSVIVSGYDKFSYAQKAIKLGAFDYLLKPIFESTYFAMLERVKRKLGGDVISSVVNEYFDPSLPRYLQKAMEYVERNYDGEIQLGEAAASAGVSAAHLSSQFTKHLGLTFIDFVKYYRVQTAAMLLEKSPVDLPLDEIAEETGFCDASYLTRCFKKLRGVSPRKYQIDYYEKTKNKDG